MAKYTSDTILFVVCLSKVIPIIYDVTTSVRSQTEVVSTGFRLLPVNWIVDNYVAILENTSSAPILRWIWNSVFIAVSHTLLVVIIVSIIGYAYFRMKFKGREVLIFSLLAISFFLNVVN